MMSNKILILVEGKADVTFIKDYLIFLNSGFTPTVPNKKSSGKEVILTTQTKKIKIIAIGGYTSINNSISTIREHIDDQYSILVIQDTDDLSKNDGGFKQRIEYLEKIKSNLSIQFEVFLFPNHNEDGDLETLLLKIINQSIFQKIHTYYLQFIHSEKAIGGIYTHELEERKNVIYNYIRKHDGMEKAKEENRYYDNAYWNFTNPDLDPLYNFLKPCL